MKNLSQSDSAFIHPLLDNIWRTKAKAKILLTDLTSLHVFCPLCPADSTVIYERTTLDPLIALRVLIAAYVHDGLPRFNDVLGYLAHPSPRGLEISLEEFNRKQNEDSLMEAMSLEECDTWMEEMITEEETIEEEETSFEASGMELKGCLPNPDAPRPSDQEVFATRKRHSDFDVYTLLHSREEELQFLRWKAGMKKNAERMQNLRPGDVLSATTDGFARDHATLRPYWPVDVDRIPSSTLQFIEAVRRPSSLDDRTRSRLENSVSFRLSISEALGDKCSTVHRCQITSIDNEPVTPGLPDLCIKLFDDRLFDVRPLD